MANTVQLTKNGQPVFPVTDVSLVMGLQDAIKLPPVKVATLPTASADTAGKMYYVGPDENDEYERYITSAVNGSYEWIDLGNTAIPLPSIADNLTTDDANTALAAAQGKVLDGKISQLRQEVDGGDFAITGNETSGKYINASGTVVDNGSFKIVTFPVTQGTVKVTIPATATQSTPYFCFYEDNRLATVKGMATRTNSIAGSMANLTVPAGAGVLAVSIVSSATPTAAEYMDGITQAVQALEELPAKMENAEEQLQFSSQTDGLVFTDSATDQLAKTAIKAIWLTYGSGVIVRMKDAVNSLLRSLANTKLYITDLYNVAGTYGCFFQVKDAATGGNNCFSTYMEGIHTISGTDEEWTMEARSGSAVYPSGFSTPPFALHIAIDWNALNNKTVTLSGNHTIEIDIGKLHFGGRGSDITVKEQVQADSASIKAIDIRDKVIVNIGDSLTEITDAKMMHYSDYIEELTGARCINIGIGGSQIRQRRQMAEDLDALPTSTDAEKAEKSRYAYATLDIINMVKAIVANDFTEQDKAVAWLASENNDDNSAIIARAKAIDWSKVNGVTVFGGTNDWASNNPILGASGSTDVNYTLGAVNETIRILLTAFPNIKIYWFTPIVRWMEYAGSTGTDANWSDVRQYADGTLRVFAKAIQDEVALNHIPVCDLYNTLGINKANFANYFPANDGTHPQTVNGLTLLGKKITAFILANNTL